MTFTIKIPEELDSKGKVFYVLRVHNGKLDRLPTEKNRDGSLSFKTDRFSTYSLIYEEADVVNVTDMMPWLIMVALGAVVVCMVAVILKKRKKED